MFTYFIHVNLILQFFDHHQQNWLVFQGNRLRTMYVYQLVKNRKLHLKTFHFYQVASVLSLSRLFHLFLICWKLLFHSYFRKAAYGSFKKYVVRKVALLNTPPPATFSCPTPCPLYYLSKSDKLWHYKEDFFPLYGCLKAYHIISNE